MILVDQIYTNIGWKTTDNIILYERKTTTITTKNNKYNNQVVISNLIQIFTHTQHHTTLCSFENALHLYSRCSCNAFLFLFFNKRGSIGVNTYDCTTGFVHILLKFMTDQVGQKHPLKLRYNLKRIFSFRFSFGRQTHNSGLFPKKFVRKKF